MTDGFNIVKEILSKGKLSIFAGSGISVDSGLPTWDEFVDKYIEICEQLNDSLEEKFRFSDIIEDAKSNKKVKIISAITALKEKISEIERRGVNTDFCNEQLNRLFYGAEPCDYHKDIVSTNYRHIITTNYDSLLEQAANIEGYKELLTRSYSYNEQRNLSIAIYSGKTAIVHAHGKIADIKLEQFVLTEKDYTHIMKHNPGFRLIMNSIFLSTSVLFVGYGGSDPHFEDIINDLNITLNWENESADLPRCYIMLLKDKATPIREFLNDKKRVDIITFDEYSQMEGFLRKLSQECPRSRTV